MSCYSKILTQMPEFNNISRTLSENGAPIVITGLSHIHKAHFIHSLCCELDRRALVLADSESAAAKLAEDLNAMASEGSQPSYLYPERDFMFRNLDGSSHDFEHRRIGILSHMVNSSYTAVCCSAQAAVQHTIPPEELVAHTLTLRSGGNVEMESVIESLTGAGYARCEQVEGTGQYAARGGILDFFPPGNDYPVRIEFWGDSIDTMAIFDAEDQRRIDNIDEISILPATETVFDSPAQLAGMLKSFTEGLRGRNAAFKKSVAGDIERLENGVSLSSYDRYLPIIYQRAATLFDYAEDALVFVCESASVEEHLRSFCVNQNEAVKHAFEDGLLCSGLDVFWMDSSELPSVLEDRGAVIMDNFPRGSYPVKLRLNEYIQCGQLSSWSGGIAGLAEDLDQGAGETSVVMAGTPKAALSLCNDLYDGGFNAVLHRKNPESFTAGAVNVISGTLSSGFSYPSVKFRLISYGGRHSAQPSKLRKRRRKAAEIFNSLEELRRGDYVVHAAHGIGIFTGINKIEFDGVTKDYITIKYAGDDVLYVPVTQLDLVSKYIGASDNSERHIKLHKLGSQQWQKTRSRVRSAVKDIARELTELYRERMRTKGYAFSPDCDMQADFESRFEFDETEDQLRCINEIKHDMESQAPMDRLLCGDVGFGKTEVALRAAFKCAAGGKQCAILVPTTILALQHYNTIVRRMEGFPIEADMLSRFRSAKDQREIIDKLRRGSLDIIVGTHKLFSKDIKFKDLGLLIVDEEQRFGVGQKEKLKSMFPAVDVLTLSATPIPRTLNMAMSGIRDMSAIEEAPQDRHPVQTYVVEYDFGVVCDAIGRELRRGGQVYYIHNRIDSIESTALKIQHEFPNAAVEVAHGAMSEDQLSGIWRRMMDGETDVLVCTTIIETGIDVANVNTMIIEDADKMGLAQLHQLRGRVGRSSRRAFAYLTFQRGKALSEVATNRLSAIREFTEFGAGMKIAMRDLEIRGAGNILGAQQHGHMEDVGYDLYLKMLNEAVMEEKGERTAAEDRECLIDLQIQAHIPEDYIESLPQRLSIYRRIAEVRSTEDAEDVYDELIDRFGDIPPSVQGLVDIALLRNLAISAGIYEITQQKNSLIMKLSTLDMEKIAKLSGVLGRRMTVSGSDSPYITVRLAPGQAPLDCLKEALTAFDA